MLMLMPAAIIVLFVLGAIAFDFAHLHTATHELQSAAEAAAQDAVTDGIDPAGVHRDGSVVLDPLRVQRSVELVIATQATELHLVAPPEVEIVGPQQVRVTLTARIAYVFAPSLPGVPRDAVVRASATASVR